MKKAKKIIGATATLLSALLLTSAPAAANTDELLAAMDTASSKAYTYESGNNHYLSYLELRKYADLASQLADMGAVGYDEAAIAAGWRDSLEFAPQVYLGEDSSSGVFFGGDGIFAEGSNAVMLNIPYGVYAEDFFHLIPSTDGEIFVVANLELTNEYTLRQIASGKADEYLSKFFRQLSRIEGTVYFSFCPAINTWKYTFTLAQSYKSAFAHASSLCDRYAPDAKVMYTLGDVRNPGQGTVAEFYPGDDFVDAFGVKFIHTYNKSSAPDEIAAYDNRGEYYDPIMSVKSMVQDLGAVTDKEFPLVIAGCAFPWEGKAAVADYAAEMKRFYNLMPAVFPQLRAILYTNNSSSMGITNLRQNPEALQVYKDCLALPWYSGRSDGMTPTPITDVSEIAIGKSVPLSFYVGGKYADADFTVYYDSVKAGDSITFTKGSHTLEVYITDENLITRIAYNIVITADGGFTATLAEAEHDYNRNGIMDFGDVELLSGYVAKWNVDLGGMETDINGDGRTNIKDLAALRAKISAPGN